MYIDDIIVMGKTDEEHLWNLDEVLSRLERADMRLKKEKCVYMVQKLSTLATRSVVRVCSHQTAKLLRL